MELLIGPIAALAVLGSLSLLGIGLLRQLGDVLTPLERIAYGPVLGMVVGSTILLGLADAVGLFAAVLIVIAFSVIGAAVYWSSGPLSAASGEGRAAWIRLLRDQLGWWPLAVLGLLAVRFALLWSSALDVQSDGLWAGHIYIWGDWTVHLGDTTAFAYGDNFPPTHPRLAGAPLAYHYLISLTAAAMVALGMDPLAALPLQSFVLSVLLVLALYAFVLRISGDQAVATLALVLFLLGGSLGWILLLDHPGGVVDALVTNPWDRAAQEAANFRWLNPYFALIMSQRAALYGIPLALLVLTLLIAAVAESRWRLFIAAGAIAGFLPLAHLGTFAALALITPFVALLFPQRRWVAFFAVWVVVGGAFLFGVQGGEARSSSGLRWDPGWLTEEDPWPWFWVKNLGLYLPLGIVGLITPVLPRDSRRLLLAFMPIFVVANLFILSVFKWDNSKVILFFFLALAILAAATVVAVWRAQRDLLSRAALILAVVTMIGSGVLTNARQLMGLDRTLMARPADLALASWVKEHTPGDAVFVVGLEHNDPVPMLTGRRVVASYDAWLRSIGLDSSQQEADVRAIFRWDASAEGLLRRYGVDYVVIGDWEEENLEANREAFASRYPTVYDGGEYRVYAVDGD